MNLDLFGDERRSWREQLCSGALLLRGFALPYAANLCAALHDISSRAPLRQMFTPGGFRMSVAMTNCGACGWVSDRSGYRYDTLDPDSGQPWPAMPAAFLSLAQQAAASAGFPNFEPDA